MLHIHFLCFAKKLCVCIIFPNTCWTCFSVGKSDFCKTAEQMQTGKNGEWSDNWCLDGLTCMYTHHYPCMIDNISHTYGKAYFPFFNYFFFAFNQNTLKHRCTIFHMAQKRVLKVLCIFHCWNIEFKLKDDACYRKWCNFTTLNINWGGSPTPCMLQKMPAPVSLSI